MVSHNSGVVYSDTLMIKLKYKKYVKYVQGSDTEGVYYINVKNCITYVLTMKKIKRCLK